jgi:hypothetical protein
MEISKLHAYVYFQLFFTATTFFTEIFHRSNTSPWIDPKNRRKFFEDYARQKNFDPLVPENWLSETSKGMMKGLKV